VSHIYNEGKGSETRALLGVTLDIFPGEFLAITGASGSGKSTLLNLIGLIDNPTSGGIFSQEKDLTKMNSREKQKFQLNFTSFIFQFFNLIDNYTAIENIMFPLRLQGRSRNESMKKSMGVLEFLGLAHRAHHFPNDLSGGEQQRIAVGRAIAKESAIILADEPTAHLDSKNSEEVIALLRNVSKTYGRTVVLVTHDLDQARKADRNVVLRDGAIVKGATPSAPEEKMLP
jgi:ABC-type lipoprotein export system ATPase subunit